MTVVYTNNSAPTNVDFTYSPSDPDSGTIVRLNGTATDPDGDPLTFSWNFGDGQTKPGQNVTHQFTAGLPSYNVTLSVDDGHVGITPRPVNVTKVIPVTANTPPNCSVPALTQAVWNTPTNLTITSYDPDTRDQHRYTWFWGDGGCTVTTTTWAWHVYVHKAMFTLTVWADDLTNLPGHNVSGWGYVIVGDFMEPPVITEFTVNTNNAQIGQWVMFTGAATDIHLSLLWYKFDFGDGNVAYASGYSNATVPLRLNVSYYYTSPGAYTAYLYVTDNWSRPVTSSPQAMTIIIGNRAPLVSAVPTLTATTVYNNTFTVTASDPDSDLLRYTWNFGDGSPPVVGNPWHHPYAVAGRFFYRVYVDDLAGFVGHNVSVGAWAYITTDFTLNLVAGWNLVTVPPTGFGYKASTLGLLRNDVVSGFNLATGTYTQNFIVGVSPLPLDFAIAASTSYWVYAGVKETLHLYGVYSATPLTRTLNFTTGSGWALIGFNTANATWKASMIPGMYTGAAITTVARYNPSNGKYTSYIKGVPPTDFTLAPGEAYWVYCTQDGTLTYSP